MAISIHVFKTSVCLANCWYIWRLYINQDTLQGIVVCPPYWGRPECVYCDKPKVV